MYSLWSSRIITLKDSAQSGIQESSTDTFVFGLSFKVSSEDYVLLVIYGYAWRPKYRNSILGISKCSKWYTVFSIFIEDWSDAINL